MRKQNNHQIYLKLKTDACGDLKLKHSWSGLRQLTTSP